MRAARKRNFTLALLGESVVVVILPVSVRLCATTPTYCLLKIAEAQESGPRRNLRRNEDRPLYKSKSSESTKAGVRELLDLGSPVRGPGSARMVTFGLIGQAEFLQHGTTVVAVVPNGNKNESGLRVFLRHFQPATAFQFRLTIRAPRRPKMNYREVGRLDRIEDLLLGRSSAQSNLPQLRGQDGEA